LWNVFIYSVDFACDGNLRSGLLGDGGLSTRDENLVHVCDGSQAGDFCDRNVLDTEVSVEQSLKLERFLSVVADRQTGTQTRFRERHTVHKPELMWPSGFELVSKRRRTKSKVEFDTPIFCARLGRLGGCIAEILPLDVTSKSMLRQRRRLVIGWGRSENLYQQLVNAQVCMIRMTCRKHEWNTASDGLASIQDGLFANPEVLCSRAALPAGDAGSIEKNLDGLARGELAGDKVAVEAHRRLGHSGDGRDVGGLVLAVHLD
jgi:hypothetical protein